MNTKLASAQCTQQVITVIIILIHSNYSLVAAASTFIAKNHFLAITIVKVVTDTRNKLYSDLLVATERFSKKRKNLNRSQPRINNLAAEELAHQQKSSSNLWGYFCGSSKTKECRNNIK